MTRIPLSGMKIVLLGGDRRELVLAEKLLEKGAALTLTGFPQEGLLPSAADSLRVF